MKLQIMFAAAVTLALLGTGFAQAQAPAKPGAAAAKPRTAKSIECSKQADAKGLRGKARKKFRSQCKRG